MMLPSAVAAVAPWHAFVLIAAWVATVGFLLSGLQDSFYAVSRLLWGAVRFVRYRGRPRLSLERLRAMDRQWVAVFVPAWSEADVIGKMVENLLERVEYDRYVCFVGTYPNDPATQAAVDAVAAAHPRIVKIVTARPGPTSKADCLNNVYEAMLEYERAHGITFEIVAMHDAEDFVHPLELLVFNYLLPRVAAVQLPILPMPTSHGEWVHWTYADEFALNHMSDIIAREHTSGFVPFAGTGMAFSRRALVLLHHRFGATLFTDGALTEDYATGRRMRELGLPVAFVNVTLVDERSPWWRPMCKRRYFVSNWAYFPKTLARAVRQKARWITGIAIQEWARSGWSGDLLTRGDLVKDRKGLVTPFLVVVGYFVGIYELAVSAGRAGWIPVAWKTVLDGRALGALVMANVLLVGVTVFERVVVVSRVYGPTAGLLSVPRLFVANVVNFVAAWRAMKTLVAARRGKRMTWDKTQHVEGLGAHPAETACEAALPAAKKPLSDRVRLRRLRSARPAKVASVLVDVARFGGRGVGNTLEALVPTLLHDEDWRVRAAIAGALVTMRTLDADTLRVLLEDRDWVVRANTARAVLRDANARELVRAALSVSDGYGREVLVRSLENEPPLTADLLAAGSANDTTAELDRSSIDPTWDELLTELEQASVRGSR